MSGATQPKRDAEVIQTTRPASASALLRHFADLRDGTQLGTGEVATTGLRSTADGGSDAIWALSWPGQRAAGLKPVLIHAYFGAGFAHPHLQSGTVGDWPLNVYDEAQAVAELPNLRAMAAADLHNLVFELGGDVRIIPATVAGGEGKERDD